MEVKIFGCRFNKYYAQKWLNFLKDDENAILIASCAVTDRAKKKFIKEVKQQIKKGKKVYLTGCGAFSKNGEIDYAWFYNAYPSLLDYKENIILLPEDTARLQKIMFEVRRGAEEVGRVKIAEEIRDLIGLSEDKKQWKVESGKGQIESKNNPLQTSSEFYSDLLLYTKGFVIVQLGCDSHCTFCITVKKRGAHKNKSVKEVIDEINNLYEKGVKEVVLTGINLAAWGMSNTNTWPNPHFPKFLREILNNTDIPRIRISSIGPEFVEDSWFEVLENPRILPYFHLSVQSASDKILKLMGRHYNKKHLIYIVENLQKLNKSVPVNIGADIIVGFPGETEEDFLQTKDFCENYISKLHVFPFSSHQIGDTVPASKFPNQIDLTIKKQREKILIDICNKNYQNLISQTKGKKVKVLIEDKGKGWTENYLPYQSDEKYNAGEIVEIVY